MVPFMGNDIILNKIEIIERCLERIKEVYDDNPNNLKNFTLQDSMVLNLQRGIEAAIDIAMNIVSENKLGIPQSSRDAFELLQENGLISEELMHNMNNMIGFRNIAVHNYQKLDIEILQNIIEIHLSDFNEFIEVIIKI